MSAVSVDERRPEAAAGSVRIRDAKEGDLAAIVAIYNEAIATRVATAQLDPVTVEDRRDWIKEHSSDRHPFWVAEIDGHVAGWLTAKPFLQRCAYAGTIELSVYVDKRFRRRGIARTLLSVALSRAESLGWTAMVGLIFAHNEPSLRLFSQYGFERWGYLPRVALLDGKWADLTIMGRHVGIAECREGCRP